MEIHNVRWIFWAFERSVMEFDLPDNLGLTRLPPRVDLIIYLIKAELKNTRFTNQLEQIGFDTSLSSLDFGGLILELAGFSNRNDELFDWYNQLVEDYSNRLDDPADPARVNEVAFDFYNEIQKKKDGDSRR